MQIRRVEIQNFRGIRELTWDVGSPVACLLGPGDSTKSTVLDAIELALTPRWNPSFSDADFHQCEKEKPIQITVTVGQLPLELVRDDKFGMMLRGWSPDGTLRDEPEDNDEKALSVRLQVTDSLEPAWHVVNERVPEGKTISAKDREAFCVVRLSNDTDRHLSWSRNSALARLSGDQSAAAQALTNAYRSARKALSETAIEGFKAAATSTEASARAFGVAPRTGYQLALDTKSILTPGTISLHDGEVPLRLAGLGTRRLVALGLQRGQTEVGSIVLIDEVEHGLEPFRVRHLVRQLRSEDGSRKRLEFGQVIMTTHSATVLLELSAEDLRIVRSSDGRTSIQTVDTDLQGFVRKYPETLLGRSVVICEGETEEGLLKGLESAWSEQDDGLPLACMGVVIKSGKGSSAPGHALDLAKLGYRVLLFRDSDIGLAQELKNKLQTAGVSVLEWKDATNTESRIAADLAWAALVQLVGKLSDGHSPSETLGGVAAVLGADPNIPRDSLESFVTEGHQQAKIREAFASVARGQKWFKSIDKGVGLGTFLAQNINPNDTGDLNQKILALRKWCYE